MNTLHEIVVIRGAPGIGKSTLASLLKITCLFEVVVDIDDIRGMINGEQFAYGENLHYLNAVDTTCTLINTFLKYGNAPIAVIDVFSKPILDRFLANANINSVIIVNLFSSNEVLIHRMKNRKSGFIDFEVTKKINSEIKECLCGNECLFIDTSNLDPKGLLIKLQQKLQGRLKVDRSSYECPNSS